jgi:hypothetical protein
MRVRVFACLCVFVCVRACVRACVRESGYTCVSVLMYHLSLPTMHACVSMCSMCRYKCMDA